MVFVFSRLSDGGLSTGSGFVIDPNGLVVTAQHIFQAGGTPGIVIPGSPQLPAAIVAADRNADIVILRVNRTGLPTIPLGDSATLRQGDEVLAIGYPRAEALGINDSVVTRGIVSSLRPDLIQIDAALNPGNSGGPILNLRGDVVGIAVAGLRGAAGINFAVPINSLKPMLASVGSSATSPPPAGGPNPIPAPTASPAQASQGSECRPVAGDDRLNEGGNDIANCVVELKGPTRVRLSVRYAYTSTLGTQNIWMGLDVLAGGNRLRWFNYRVVPITGSSGTASFEIAYGQNNPPAGKLTTDQVEFFMYVGGGQIFSRRMFNVNLDWQL